MIGGSSLWLLGVALQAAAPPPVPELQLRDVPRVGYDVHLNPFCGSLYAWLQHAGQPVDYDYLMGVSGACFRRAFNRDDGGNVDLMYFAPEPHRRALEAVGRRWRTVPYDRETMLAALTESLTAGRPVLGFGLVGPPEAGLVTGVSGGGTVLHGWSYFQEQHDRPYDLPDWFTRQDRGVPFGLLQVLEAGERPGAREVLVSALEWAVDLARRSHRPHDATHIYGLAAGEAWAAALELDADYPAGDRQVLATRAMVHCDQVVMLHERRSAAAFLRQMSQQVPEAAGPLRAAADAYEQAAKLAGELWRWPNNHDPAALDYLAESAHRVAYAATVRAALTHEAAATAKLEEALALLRGAGEQPALRRLDLQPSALVNYPARYRPNIEGLVMSSMGRAVAELIGEDFGYSLHDDWRTNEVFPWLVGLSGEAFELVWLAPDGAVGRADAAADPAWQQRWVSALDAIGLETEAVVPRPETGDALRLRAVHCLANLGLPLIVMGWEEQAGKLFLVTGYDDAGATLLGWRQEPGDDGIRFVPDQRVALHDWTRAPLLLLPLSRHLRAGEAEASRDALAQAVALMQTRPAAPQEGGAVSYDHWIAQVREPAHDAAAGEQGHRVLDPNIWDLATRRHYGSLFLERAAKALPAVSDDLLAAAQAFHAQHDLMWEVYRQAGGKWPDMSFPLAGDLAARQAIAATLLQARAADLRAGDHLAHAVARLH